MIDWDAVSRELVAFFVALNETAKDIHLDTPKLGLLTRPATWVPMRQGSCAAPPSEKRSTVSYGKFLERRARLMVLTKDIKPTGGAASDLLQILQPNGPELAAEAKALAAALLLREAADAVISGVVDPKPAEPEPIGLV
jgi:hypothetical protein